ncbi:hypothetical protein HPB49_005604 [Dermacentor silvarum]|uniref:Uncharacterized protein n=1 Tax=Dermacentor silvarum TaxID=543639 RepID=A0ACB8DVG0_DERSI|nr:hypothetical protein HPB49_005604 [Dermacentor silvarum]
MRSVFRATYWQRELTARRRRPPPLSNLVARGQSSPCAWLHCAASLSLHDASCPWSYHASLLLTRPAAPGPSYLTDSRFEGHKPASANCGWSTQSSADPWPRMVTPASVANLAAGHPGLLFLSITIEGAHVAGRPLVLSRPVFPGLLILPSSSGLFLVCGTLVAWAGHWLRIKRSDTFAFSDCWGPFSLTCSCASIGIDNLAAYPPLRRVIGYFSGLASGPFMAHGSTACVTMPTPLGIPITSTAGPFSLPTSSLSLELATIVHATHELTFLPPSPRYRICSDSMAAIRALRDNRLPDNLHDNLSDALSLLSPALVTVVWGPGHTGIIVNQLAHELAREINSRASTIPWPCPPIADEAHFYKKTLKQH